MRRIPALVILTLAVCLLYLTPADATYSIVARDADTGDLGVAVQSKFLGVGAVVPFARAGTGAVATQALGNPTYGPRGLDLLDSGLGPQRVIETLTATDEQKSSRQIAVLPAEGEPAAFTGAETLDYSGHVTGDHFAVQGNILAGPEVLQAMADAFEASSAEPLGERLIAALRAGEEAGGDQRGSQSAALVIVREGGGYGGHTGRMVDIRVDDHDTPIEELDRIYRKWQETFSVDAWLSTLGRYREEVKQRHVDWALEVVNRVEQRGDPDPQLLNSLAWGLATNNIRTGKAVELAERAHEAAPENPAIIDTLAEAHWHNGDTERAVSTIKKAIELDPDNQYYREQLEKFENEDSPSTESPAEQKS